MARGHRQDQFAGIAEARELRTKKSSKKMSETIASFLGGFAAAYLPLAFKLAGIFKMNTDKYLEQ